MRLVPARPRPRFFGALLALALSYVLGLAPVFEGLALSSRLAQPGTAQALCLGLGAEADGAGHAPAGDNHRDCCTLACRFDGLSTPALADDAPARLSPPVSRGVALAFAAGAPVTDLSGRISLARGPPSLG